MADFAIWATACETALWPAGTFMEAYDRNRDEAVDQVIDADLVADAVRSFMESRPEWEGTASRLLQVLNEQSGETVTRSTTWPKDPTRLSGRLKRAATFLRKVGIYVTFRDRTGQKRTILITTTAPDWVRNAASSASSASQTPENNDLPVTLADTHDADSVTSVTAIRLQSKGNDASDASDAEIPTQSGWQGDDVSDADFDPAKLVFLNKGNKPRY